MWENGLFSDSSSILGIDKIISIVAIPIAIVITFLTIRHCGVCADALFGNRPE